MLNADVLPKKMMKVETPILALLLLVTAVSCRSTQPETVFFSKPHVQYHPNGQKELEVVVDRPGDGRILKWYDNGTLSELHEFQLHRYNGLHRTWNPDGVLVSEQTWRNGKVYGSSIVYRPNGTKYSEAVVQDGKMISRCWWDDEGVRHEGRAPIY